MTELEKMTDGKLYNPNVPEILELRNKAHRLCFEYNHLSEEQTKERNKIIKELLPNIGKNPGITGPIYFDYGFNFHVGDNFYCNFNFTCLDICEVIIGDNVFCGPNVAINTPLHPLLAKERNQYIGKDGMTDVEYGKKIIIGSNCWIASNVTICAGAKIGNNCVIGAGSVVTGTIPDGYIAYGVPAKPIRKIEESDSVYLKEELF